jgi:hypothetical protein
VVGAAEPFASDVTQYYAFEALLDERAVGGRVVTPDILLWNGKTRSVSRPIVTPASHQTDATTTLWRNVWMGSDRDFSCGRRVRDAFSKHYAEAQSRRGTISAELLLAAAVIDCYATLDSGDGKPPDVECGCGALATRAAALAVSSETVDSAGDDDDAIWRTVWRGSEVASRCSSEVRRRFGELHRMLRKSSASMTLAPYEILATAVRSCVLEASDGAGSPDCACGPFDPASPEEGVSLAPMLGVADVPSARGLLLMNHLRRNNLLKNAR